jgi:hypothetical protein
MFDAVWKTGELAISAPVTHRLKSPQPTLEDAARCYGRIAGINPETFLSAAHSFGVEVKIAAADAQVAAMQFLAPRESSCTENIGSTWILYRRNYRPRPVSRGQGKQALKLRMGQRPGPYAVATRAFA